MSSKRSRGAPTRQTPVQSRKRSLISVGVVLWLGKTLVEILSRCSDQCCTARSEEEVRLLISLMSCSSYLWNCWLDTKIVPTQHIYYFCTWSQLPSNLLWLHTLTPLTIGHTHTLTPHTLDHTHSPGRPGGVVWSPSYETQGQCGQTWPARTQHLIIKKIKVNVHNRRHNYYMGLGHVLPQPHSQADFSRSWKIGMRKFSYDALQYEIYENFPHTKITRYQGRIKEERACNSTI